MLLGLCVSDCMCMCVYKDGYKSIGNKHLLRDLRKRHTGQRRRKSLQTLSQTISQDEEKDPVNQKKPQFSFKLSMICNESSRSHGWEAEPWRYNPHPFSQPRTAQLPQAARLHGAHPHHPASPPPPRQLSPMEGVQIYSLAPYQTCMQN